MKRLAAAILVAAFARQACADGSLLVTSAAASIGAEATTRLVRTPYAGLGVFATHWETEDHGNLNGVGVRLGWNVFKHLSLDARASTLKSKSGDRKTTLIPLEAAATFRWPLGQRLVPYLGGGIGYYMMDAEIDDTESGNDSENVAGYFALAGLSLHLGPVSLFGEAKYTLVGTDNDLDWRGSDLHPHNSLDGLAWNAGLKLGF